MADDLKITDPYSVPLTFVAHVLGQGHANGIVNLTLGAPRWTPTGTTKDEPEGVVDMDMIITSRLRMDLACAQQLRDALDTLLKKILPEAGATEH